MRNSSRTATLAFCALVAIFLATPCFASFGALRTGGDFAPVGVATVVPPAEFGDFARSVQALAVTQPAAAKPQPETVQTKTDNDTHILGMLRDVG